MNENIIENMEQEIQKNKKFPQELTDKINKKAFYNIMISIVITIYFIFINLGYYNIEKTMFVTDLKVFSCFILFVSIILFEQAYIKDKEGLFLNGVEILILAIITLFMPYTLFDASLVVKKITMLSFLFFAIYYNWKAIILCIKIKKDYNHNISDVREIIKKGKEK